MRNRGPRRYREISPECSRRINQAIEVQRTCMELNGIMDAPTIAWILNNLNAAMVDALEEGRRIGYELGYEHGLEDGREYERREAAPRIQAALAQAKTSARRAATMAANKAAAKRKAVAA